MNFVLVHIGSTPPVYLEHCFRQIAYTNPTSAIYLISDQYVKCSESVFQVSCKDLQIPDIKDYYKHDAMSVLFRGSMLRLFYLKSFLDVSRVTDVIHFDNDVLVYKDLSQYKPVLQQHPMYMTAHNSKEFVFGMSYIRDNNSLNFVNRELYDLVCLGERRLQTVPGIDGMPHEMRLLRYINDVHSSQFIRELPITPNHITFSDFNVCFDPSSYGQYLGGRAPEEHHTIGEMLLKDVMSVKFEKQIGYPVCCIKDKETPIVNLHIHNKRLDQFITYEI